MIIYQGSFLQIHHKQEKKLLHFFWSKSPTTFLNYKEEMLVYVSLLKKHKPKYMIWNNTNFELQFNQEIVTWIETNISTKVKEIGIKKTALIIGHNVKFYMGLINFFKREGISNTYTPKHFSTEREAENWIFNNVTKDISIDTQLKKHQISFEGVDKKGNSTFKIKTKSGNILNTIEFLNQFLEQQEIVENYQEKFNNLTEREIEITRLFAKNEKISDIADKLFISIHTARTHWKNIKQKLELNANMEIARISEIYFEMTDYT